MDEPAFIKKRDLKKEPTGFSALREEGIRLAQAFSSNIWSDYNLHDPGVTMLESLCYGLTDLIHRTGFSTEDYFSDEKGFEPEACGMVPPEKIFPCGPVTKEDLRRFLFDVVDGVENIWVEPKGRGLWRVVVKKEREEEERSLIERVEEAYHSVRNLGEDLGEVVILNEVSCSLSARVEVDGLRDSHEVLAEIYHICREFLSPSMHTEHPEKLIKEGRCLEDVFEGPLTRHGTRVDSGLSTRKNRVMITDVISAVREIEGVLCVEQLFFVTQEGDHYHCVEIPCEDSCFSLEIPSSFDEVGLTLHQKGKEIFISLPEFRNRYFALKYQAGKSPPYAPETLYALPRGEHRAFGEYTSIQNHFPTIYGINAFGVPASYPEERRAAAAQLKGYLSLMEQPLADGMATLASLHQLFSPDEGIEQTTFGSFLTDEMIPGISALHLGENPEKSYEKRVKKSDAFYTRRSAFLAHLLALYGESVDPDLLKRSGGYLSNATEQAAHLHAQISLLKRLPHLSANRLQGTNYKSNSKGRPEKSPVEERLEILFGFTLNQSGSLTLPITRDGLKLISDEAFLSIDDGALAVGLGKEGEELTHLYPVVGSRAETKITCDDIAELKELIAPFRRNLLFESLLRHGTKRSYYRLAITSTCNEVKLLFNLNGSWLFMGSAETKKHAVRLVHLLRYYLIFLNMATEGLHLVEEVLLSPPVLEEKSPGNNKQQINPQILHIICPDWTDRFFDSGFRTLFMETASSHLPVHLMPRFHFLSFEEMISFEGGWNRLREARRRGDWSGCERANEVIVTLLGEAQVERGRFLL
ncbi:MAG: hypothetical protein MI742_13310 [Desulfobacterales bacterium]|nr:hypothetical protein [Desulfobacterales bacterium]